MLAVLIQVNNFSPKETLPMGFVWDSLCRNQSKINLVGEPTCWANARDSRGRPEVRPQPLRMCATIQGQEPPARRDRGHEEHLSWWQGTVTSSGHRLGDRGLLLLCGWP